MKEEFDHYIKNQMESLNRVPDLEFDEKKVWNKVKLGTVSSSGGGLLPFIGLSLIIVIGIFYYAKEQDFAKKDNKPIIVLEKPDTSSIEKTVVDTATIVKKKGVVSKKNKLPNTIVAMKNTMDTIKKEVPYSAKINTDSTGQKNTIKTPMPEDDAIDSTKTNIAFSSKINRDKTQQQNRASASFKKHRLRTKKASLGKAVSSDEIQKEVVLSLSNYSAALGLNYVNPLTESSSFVYGTHLRKFYALNNDSDWINYSNSLNIEIPLQFRYHLNFTKSRFSAFLYGGAINSFNFSQTEKNAPYGLRFESGAELRYLIFKNKKNKKAYLFFRLPFYNTTLINNNRGPSPFNFGKQ